MHEISLVKDIMDVVQKNLPVGSKQKIQSVSVRMGDVMGVAPESLRLCFKTAGQGTQFQDASLKIETVPVQYQCSHCSALFEPGRPILCCPKCGSNVVAMTGYDLNVVEFETDVPDLQTESMRAGDE